MKFSQHWAISSISPLSVSFPATIMSVMAPLDPATMATHVLEPAESELQPAVYSQEPALSQTQMIPSSTHVPEPAESKLQPTNEREKPTVHSRTQIQI